MVGRGSGFLFWMPGQFSVAFAVIIVLWRLTNSGEWSFTKFISKCFEDVFPHCFSMRTLKFHGELCFWLKKHINKKASRWSIKSNAWFMTPSVVMFPHHELHWKRPNIDSQPIFRWTKTGFGGSCGNFWLPALPSTDSWLWCSTASSGKIAQNWVFPGQLLDIFRLNLVCLCKKCPFSEWMIPCCFQVFSMFLGFQEWWKKPPHWKLTSGSRGRLAGMIIGFFWKGGFVVRFSQNLVTRL